MANVNIKFNNKDYLLSCDDGQEESLKKLTVFLDKKYSELKDKLGNIGDIVSVKNGFGRNYLLKLGKALRLNKENQELVKKKKQELVKKNNVQILNLNPSKIGFRMGISNKSLIMDDLSVPSGPISQKTFPELRAYLKNYDPWKITLEYQSKNFEENIFDRYKSVFQSFFIPNEELFSKRHYDVGKTKTKLFKFRIFFI